MPRLALLLLLVAAPAFPDVAAAQGVLTEVLPRSYERSEAGLSSRYPFASSNSMRVLQAYGGDELGIRRPVRLRGIAFRPDRGATSFGPIRHSLQVDVSTAVRPARDLSRTFDANHGADRTRVFDGLHSVPAVGLGSAPHDFVVHVRFDDAFTWDPACGPLLVDIRTAGLLVGSSFVQCDGTGAGEDVGRIAHLTNRNATSANFPGSGTQNFALVAQLDLEDEVLPASANGTTPGGTRSFPWFQSPGTGMRVQYVYDGTTFAQRGRREIRRLAWRPVAGTGWRPGTYDVLVRLSTGRPNLSTSLDSVFANNVGADETVVFDGVFTAPVKATPPAPADFRLQLELQRPFSFNPDEGALVVDLLLRNTLVNSGAPFVADEGSGQGFGRVWNNTDPLAATGFAQSTALVMAFDSEVRPTLPAANDLVRGDTSSRLPWHRGIGNRSLFSYDGALLRRSEPQQIRQLGWRHRGSGAYGPMIYTCTIDLSTGSGAGSLSPIFDRNHGGDRLRVFDGKFSVPYTETSGNPNDFACTVKLDRPFLWDPSRGPLIVDVRALDVSGNLVTRFDGSHRAGLRRIADRNDADATRATIGPDDFGLDLSIGGAGCNALAETYGAACAGSNGLPINTSVGLPRIPNAEFEYRLVRGPHDSPAALVLGSSPSALDLSGAGATGCSLYSPGNFAIVPVRTNARGRAWVPSPIPNDPTLAGGRVFASWVCFDAGANAADLVTSGGLALTLCR